MKSAFILSLVFMSTDWRAKERAPEGFTGHQEADRALWVRWGRQAGGSLVVETHRVLLGSAIKR